MNLKRMFLAQLAILLFCKVNIEAQVTIGADRAPHPGAVLELESQGNHGLLLPHVSLTGASDWILDGTYVDGMMIYNENSSTTNRLKGKGLYVWTNREWRATHPSTCSSVPNVGTITLSKREALKNEVFQASVEPPAEGAIQYIWNITGTAPATGYSNTNIISLAGLAVGSVTINVKAVNPCGTGNSSQAVTVTIKNN
ncbi:MAG: hypothetical protein LBQ84_06455 [Flavobacteriaceae bacterium]|jgi:hypothetical protein|nr:hypothetical protein [Flavobacteriaceae bacterium]